MGMRSRAVVAFVPLHLADLHHLCGMADLVLSSSSSSRASSNIETIEWCQFARIRFEMLVFGSTSRVFAGQGVFRGRLNKLEIIDGLQLVVPCSSRSMAFSVLPTRCGPNHVVVYLPLRT
jgi:hypothetical protein